METERSRHDREGTRKAPTENDERHSGQSEITEAGSTVESYLTTHPRQTIYLQANGNALENKGIYPGDIVVIDMALSDDPLPGDIVLLCMIDNSFVLTEWLSGRSPHEYTRDKESDGGHGCPVVIGVKTGTIRPGRSSTGARP